MGARVPTKFGGSEKGQSLISAYRSLAITASTSGFEKLSTALLTSRKPLLSLLHNIIKKALSISINKAVQKKFDKGFLLCPVVDK